MEENITTEATESTYEFKEETIYGGFWARFGAAFIDILVFVPIILFSNYNIISIKSIALLYVLTLISALYKPLMELKYGATLGKMALRLKVVNHNLEPINVDQAFMRYLPWAISIIFQLMAATVMYNAENFQQIDTWEEMAMLAKNPVLDIISSIYFFAFL